MSYLVIVSAVLTITSAYPFVDENARRESDRTRYRRSEVAVNPNTKFGLNSGVPYVKHEMNLANSGNHRLDASAFASKDFHNNGPLVTGGGLNYAHPPSGGGLQITGTNVPRGGTNVGAAGVWNVYRNGGFGVDLRGGYNQRFGGPGGSGPPIVGVEIRGGYAFPIRG